MSKGRVPIFEAAMFPHDSVPAVHSDGDVGWCSFWKKKKMRQTTCESMFVDAFVAKFDWDVILVVGGHVSPWWWWWLGYWWSSNVVVNDVDDSDSWYDDDSFWYHHLVWIISIVVLRPSIVMTSTMNDYNYYYYYYYLRLFDHIPFRYGTFVYIPPGINHINLVSYVGMVVTIPIRTIRHHGCEECWSWCWYRWYGWYRHAPWPDV